ncbi:MAG: hypothetical protein HY296_01305 [Thaumarchaeota archaeon]|nr:hypothetical protein [Nitrososphaerota archaeon]
MAGSKPIGGRVTQKTGSEELFLWGTATTSTIFLWTFVSVVSQVFPAIFPGLIRCTNIGSHGSSFSILTPTADRFVLLICSIAILAVVGLRAQSLSYAWRATLMVPALSIASFVVSPLVLLIIGGLGTAAGLVYLVLHSDELVGSPPGRLSASILFLVVGSAAALFFVSGARWILNASDGAKPLVGWTWLASIEALRLVNLIYWVFPQLVLILFLIWPVKLVLPYLWERIRSRFSRVPPLTSESRMSESLRQFSEGRLPLAMFAIAMIFSAFVGIYPYLPSINPGSTLVGYDVNIFYFPTLQSMQAQSPGEAVGAALSNDRAGFLILQYAVSLLPRGPAVAVRIIPVLLAVLLAVTTYIFVKAGSGNRLLASTAALFAAFSFEVVSGINAGLDADWLAMSEALVFLSLLLVGLNRPDRRYVVLSSGVLVLVLFTHPWTWLVMLGLLGLYSVLTAGLATWSKDMTGLRHELTSLAMVFAISGTADLSKRLLGTPSGVQDVLNSSAHTLSLSSIPSALSSLSSSLRLFLGGALDNPLIIVLSIVGLLALPGLHSRMTRLLVSWMAIASGPLLLYKFSFSYLQARVIIIAPLQILAAVGLIALMHYFIQSMRLGGYENHRTEQLVFVLVCVAVTGAFVGYSLENVGFVYTGIAQPFPICA